MLSLNCAFKVTDCCAELSPGPEAKADMDMASTARITTERLFFMELKFLLDGMGDREDQPTPAPYIRLS
jgi:hypothetical protein